MRDPIKERIVVLRYKRMDDEVYRGVYDALVGHLGKVFAQDPFSPERLNFPYVTVPMPTIGDIDPDWTKVRVVVDRSYRFWNRSRTRCIQFFKTHFTVNLIVAQDCEDSGSHKELFDFFSQLLPFLVNHAKSFELLCAGVDYLNVLTGSQLSKYLTADGAKLDVAQLFRSDVIGKSIPGAMAVAPLSHQIVYGPDGKADNPFPAQLTVSISVPERGPEGWIVNVTLSAVGTLQNFSHDKTMEFLAAMHQAVYQGFNATFSDEIITQAKGATR